ncbi:MAG: IS21 family transposase [Planctomycetota bacterium]
MTKSNQIKRLRQQGLSHRQIAKAVGVDPKTVRRHLAPEQPKGSTAPTGSEPDQDTPAEPPKESSSSQCEPFRQAITEMLSRGLHAQRIHQDLVSEFGFQGSYYSVRRFAKTLRDQKPEAFRRMEVEPGYEAQVDFGIGIPIVDADGKKRRTHVLRVVLSHSRKGYAEVVYRQTTDDFISALENAFWAFGGVPKTVVIDNLKAAVKKPDWYDPELVPKLRAFEQHYGTAVLPTKAYTPHHKGKVERGVDYVQENALRGHKFATLTEQNDHLQRWETTVADKRIHGTTKRQVGEHFDKDERPTLLPLPLERFGNFHESRRKVCRDGHVTVAGAYYSAPPEYLGRAIWARWDGRTVRLLNDELQQIAFYTQSAKGKFNTLAEHIVSQKINASERGGAYLLGKTARIGSFTARWSETMLRQNGIKGHRVLQGLLAMSKKHSVDQIEQACDIAWRHGDFHLRTLRRLIERQSPVQQLMPFLSSHELIRPLSSYDQFVHECVQGNLQ